MASNSSIMLGLALLVLGSVLIPALSFPSGPEGEMPVPMSQRSARDVLGFGETFGFCNGLRKLCGINSPNGKDCCNYLTCVADLSLGYVGSYYCQQDPGAGGYWFGMGY